MITARRYAITIKACLRSQRGVSLVELMIASTIGLVLVLGAATLMLSVQESKVLKQSLDHMQENFRYGSNVILRVVRQGTSFAAPDGNNGIKVNLVKVDAQAEPSTHDCLGREGAVSNTFFVNENGALSCRIIRDGHPDETHALAEGYTAPLLVDYGFDSNGDGVIDTYRAVENAAEWSVPVSARITLSSNGQTVRFVVTMRPAVVAAGSGAAL